jgi:FAD/FMN-containing dehydrogenase
MVIVMTSSPALLRALETLLGPEGHSTDPDVIAPRLTEWRGRYQGTTPFLAKPRTAQEVAALVRLCSQAGAAITPQGGNTGLVAGQIPNGEILLSLERMAAIRSVSPLNDSLVVEAGATLHAVHEAAAGVNRRLPLSLASQGSATIGGLISTNAGGVHVMRHGMMREQVLGLEVVLPDGRVLNALDSLRKNNTGYDLKQLFIGAEGTLGVITAAALKLAPAVTSRVVAVAGVESADAALALFHRARHHADGLCAFELMNRLSIALALKHVPGLREPLSIAPAFTALLEFERCGSNGLEDGVEAMLADALEEGDIVDAAIARSTAQEEGLWRLRESLSAGHRTGDAQANHDISVPVSETPRFLARAEAEAQALCPGARIVAFGHMGDGNIHYTVMAPETGGEFPREAVLRSIHDLAASMGGSISAEHGIGVARREELARFKDPVALDLMRTLKAALDPNRVMNPRALV